MSGSSSVPFVAFAGSRRLPSSAQALVSAVVRSTVSASKPNIRGIKLAISNVIWPPCCILSNTAQRWLQDKLKCVPR